MGGVLYSVQPMLPEAGGQVGEVPVAVSWVWHPGAPRGGVACGEVGVPAQGRHVLSWAEHVNSHMWQVRHRPSGCVSGTPRGAGETTCLLLGKTKNEK